MRPAAETPGCAQEFDEWWKADALALETAVRPLPEKATHCPAEGVEAFVSELCLLAERTLPTAP